MRTSAACFLACMVTFVPLALSDDQAGGPDFWEVSKLHSGSAANLRRGASIRDAIVKPLARGTILRNKGCKIANGQRWCEVELKDNATMRGWVAGRFLSEAAEQNVSTDALVPGTNYHAVGRVPCKMLKTPDAKDCAFGVTRGTPGVATVFITLPDGFVRVLAFDGGQVSPQSGVSSFNSSREADSWRVNINGGDENYLIPDAIVFGG